MLKLYKMLSCFWQTDNVEGVYENDKCYKILCADESDDLVDIFSAQHHEMAQRRSKVNYNVSKWK